MNRTFTLTDLILFAYNETQLLETTLIVNELETNYRLQEAFKEVVDTIDYIESMVTEPSEKSINAILNYSRTLQSA